MAANTRTAQRTHTNRMTAWLTEARWSTRRVGTVTLTGTLIGSNPKTISAIITWGATTGADWINAAHAAGLLK